MGSVTGSRQMGTSMPNKNHIASAICFLFGGPANETSKWEPDHETIDSVRRDLSFVKRQYTPTVKWEPDHETTHCLPTCAF